MAKIIQEEPIHHKAYRVVNTVSPSLLEEEVNALMSEGYEPIGHLIVIKVEGHDVLIQQMQKVQK